MEPGHAEIRARRIGEHAGPIVDPAQDFQKSVSGREPPGFRTMLLLNWRAGTLPMVGLGDPDARSRPARARRCRCARRPRRRSSRSPSRAGSAPPPVRRTPCGTSPVACFIAGRRLLPCAPLRRTSWPYSGLRSKLPTRDRLNGSVERAEDARCCRSAPGQDLDLVPLDSVLARPRSISLTLHVDADPSSSAGGPSR